MDERFAKIKESVDKELSCSAHSMDHVMRVYNTCKLLAADSNADYDVLLPAALLHDIARVKEDNDSTGKTDHAVVSAQMAGPILTGLGYSPETISKITHCILAHRYRTGHTPQTTEAKILFDADKLDSIGAIGIARSFVWVGRNNAGIYRKPDMDVYTQENLGGKANGRIQDKTKHSPQIEYETKTKFLIEKMHLPKSKEVCMERLAFYKSVLDRLEKEVKGEL